MKNKRKFGFQSWNMLLIFGATAVMFLVSPSQMQLVFSSVYHGSETPSTSLVPPVFKGEQSNNSGQSQGGSQDDAPNPSDGSGGGASNSNQQQAINHINQAQSALQNGDTEGAQMHMDAAKQALHCEGCEP